MPNLFIISDTHFCHFNIIRYTGRNFSTYEEMNEYMIEKWNSVVNKEDIVLHAGDFGFGRTATLNRLIDIRARLNGAINLFRGSHDRIHSRRQWLEFIKIDKYIEKHLECVEIGKKIIIVYLKDESCLNLQIDDWQNKEIIYVSHRPIKDQKAGPYYYGHIHEKVLPEHFGTNVCVEQKHIDYIPMKIGEF